MREVGASLGVPIHVFGPETHMTAIVGMALGKIFPMTIDAIRFFCCHFIRKTSNRST
jgi:ATP citrate (pro-S)-lyase